MADIFSQKKRSEIMSKISSNENKYEIFVRKFLFSNGLRYRKNDPRYVGKPDIVLPKYKTMIFINGCFWHGHEGCKKSKLPLSNIEFWKEKINSNKERDLKNIEFLKGLGWRVIVLWQCELSKFQQEDMKKLLLEIKDV